MTGDQPAHQQQKSPVATVPGDADTAPVHADTVTITMVRDDLGLRRMGRLMRTVGIVGVVAGIAAIAVSLWLLHDMDAMLGRSLVLTADSLETVDASLSVATESVGLVSAGLDDAEQTSRGLEESLSEGSDLLAETARLTRTGVADSLESFEQSMPALIQVTGTVDSTLRAVDQLPVGPEYDPDEPFDESLRELRDDLDGLPEDLREQADAVDDASDNLATVGRQSTEIADSMLDVRLNLDRAGRVLGRYQATTSEARELIGQTRDDLRRRLWILRGLAILLGLIYCVGQVLPIYLGNRMAQAFAPPPPPDQSNGSAPMGS